MRNKLDSTCGYCESVTTGHHGRALPRGALLRLRARSWPILQTAGAAVAAWYLATLLTSEQQPVFASIAAVISLGATYGQRPERTIELIGGVVLGIGIADLLVRTIGSGPVQLGLMVVLAMAAAVLLGGGAVLVTEAAVSATLLVLLDPAGTGLAPSRVIEARVGGGVALAEGDLIRSDAALQAARAIDDDLRALDEALVIGGETARFSPGRRSSRGELDRYARAARHVDFAVRNTRVLARHAARYVRAGGSAPAALPEAIHELALAVWALAAELDHPTGNAEVRTLASRAASRATEVFDENRELGLGEIVAQVRSTAVDLVRAAEVAAAAGEPSGETPTEELLIAPPQAGAPAQVVA